MTELETLRARFLELTHTAKVGTPKMENGFMKVPHTYTAEVRAEREEVKRRIIELTRKSR